MFYGEKMKEIRELNGLSRKELADKLEITEQAVWQYENEKFLPRIEILNKLREFFAVETRYFFTPSYLNNAIVSEEKIAYRADDRESRKKTKLELAYLNFIDYYIRYFEKNIMLPNNTIKNIRNKCLEYIHKASPTDRIAAIQQIAIYARKKLRISNNRDLMYILENSGIYVLEKNLGATIDAYSTCTEDGRLYIILGTMRKSAVRRNFDLAHELGHLLLHDDIDMELLSSQEFKSIEKEADLFASAFLLPEKEFIADFANIRRKSNPDAYLELKRKYMVSIASLEMRAYHLDLINYQENRYFWAQLYKKGYRKYEPLDDEIVPIKPAKMRSLIRFTLDNKVIHLDQVLQEFLVLPTFLEKLFNLEHNFFQPYLEQKQEYFSLDNIVDLKQYQ